MRSPCAAKPSAWRVQKHWRPPSDLAATSDLAGTAALAGLSVAPAAVAASAIRAAARGPIRRGAVGRVIGRVLVRPSPRTTYRGELQLPRNLAGRPGGRSGRDRPRRPALAAGATARPA